MTSLPSLPLQKVAFPFGGSSVLAGFGQDMSGLQRAMSARSRQPIANQQSQNFPTLRGAPGNLNETNPRLASAYGTSGPPTLSPSPQQGSTYPYPRHFPRFDIKEPWRGPDPQPPVVEPRQRQATISFRQKSRGIEPWTRLTPGPYYRGQDLDSQDFSGSGREKSEMDGFSGSTLSEQDQLRGAVSRPSGLFSSSVMNGMGDLGRRFRRPTPQGKPDIRQSGIRDLLNSVEEDPTKKYTDPDPGGRNLGVLSSPSFVPSTAARAPIGSPTVSPGNRTAPATSVSRSPIIPTAPSPVPRPTPSPVPRPTPAQQNQQRAANNQNAQARGYAVRNDANEIGRSNDYWNNQAAAQANVDARNEQEAQADVVDRGQRVNYQGVNVNSGVAYRNRNMDASRRADIERAGYEVTPEGVIRKAPRRSIQGTPMDYSQLSAEEVVARRGDNLSEEGRQQAVDSVQAAREQYFAEREARLARGRARRLAKYGEVLSVFAASRNIMSS